VIKLYKNVTRDLEIINQMGYIFMLIFWARRSQIHILSLSKGFPTISLTFCHDCISRILCRNMKQKNKDSFKAATTLCIMTFSIMTLRIRSLDVTLSISAVSIKDT
jgi:hypothetical protein